MFEDMIQIRRVPMPIDSSARIVVVESGLPEIGRLSGPRRAPDGSPFKAIKGYRNENCGGGSRVWKIMPGISKTAIGYTTAGVHHHYRTLFCGGLSRGARQVR